MTVLGKDASAAYKKADQALYDSKNTGRNRVTVRPNPFKQSGWLLVVLRWPRRRSGGRCVVQACAESLPQ